MSEPDRPAHYARHVIDPITFAVANGLSPLQMNVIKYVCRYDAKGGAEDLLKARRCIDMMLETLERERRIAAGEDAAVVWGKIL